MSTFSIQAMGDRIQGTGGLFSVHELKNREPERPQIYPDEVIKSFNSSTILEKEPIVTQLLREDRATAKQSCSRMDILKNQDGDGNSIFMVFAKTGRLDLMTCLPHATSASFIKKKSKSGATALHFASGRKDNIPTIDWLLSTGLDVNDADNDGNTPLLVAAFDGHIDAVETMLHNQAEVDCRDNYNRTPLMAASQQGHVKVVQKLIECGAKVNNESDSRKTALFYACKNNHRDVVEVLVSANKDLLDHKDKDGQTVGMKCAAYGNLDMLKLLLSHRMNLDVKDNCLLTAFMIASMNGHVQLVQYLLKEHHAKLDDRKDDRKTALCLAASTGRSHVLRVLLEAGADPGEGDNLGDTPLILATRRGSIECVELLLEVKPVIDQQNEAGKTALMEAILSQKYDIAKLLHEKGASVSLTSKSGQSATDLASVSKNEKICEYFMKIVPAMDQTKKLFLAIEYENLEVVKEASDLNVRTAKGATPLMIAAGIGSLEIVHYLCNHGASVTAETDDGITAIACAVSYEKMKVVDALIGYGANVDMKNKKGQTLLVKCIEDGSLGPVKSLERLGANLEMTDRSGKTPLMLAAEKNHVQIVQYLVDMGAKLDTRSKDGRKALEYAEAEVKSILEQKEAEFNASTENHSMGRKLIVEASKGDQRKLRALIESKAPVNYKDRKHMGITPLIVACQKGLINNVKRLCEAGAKTYLKGGQGSTPLISASFNGHTQIVKYLLEKHCANPNVSDDDGRTAIMCASQEGHQEIAALLIKFGGLVNLKEIKGGQTALNYACIRGNLDILMLLLNEDANTEVKDYEGRTVLSSACLNGYIDIVEHLCKKGAKVNHIDSLYRTPLMAACQEGRLPVVKFLVKAGADISITSNNGMRAIDFAERRCKFDVVQWLREQGAASDQKGNSSKIIDMRLGMFQNDATKNTSSSSSTLQERLLDMCGSGQATEEDLKGLVKSGAQLNEKGEQNMVPLIKAVTNGHRHIVSWLLQAGADVNCKDSNGRTPLLHAVTAKDMRMIELLIRHKADHTLMDNYGEDAFVYATKANDDELVMKLIDLLDSVSRPEPVPTSPGPKIAQIEEPEYNVISLLSSVEDCTISKLRHLLQQNVDVNITDTDGNNALHHCAVLQTEDATGIVELLIQNGTNINFQNKHGETPLIECCHTGNIQIVRILLHSGADKSVVSKYGTNALEEACVWNYCELVHILVREQSWPKESLDKCRFYAITNNLDCMISMLGPCNPIDVIEHLTCNVSLTDDFTQHLYGSEQWTRELSVLLAVVYNVETLALDDSVNLSDEVKWKALQMALERGYYEAAGSIHRSASVSPRSWIYVVIESIYAEGESGYQTTGPDISSTRLQQSASTYAEGESGYQTTTADITSTRIQNSEKMNVNNADTDSVEDSDVVEEKFSDDEIDVQMCLNQTMDAMYKLFTRIFVKESPKYIQGFSRNWVEPIIYIYAALGKKTDAQKYVENKINTLRVSGAQFIRFDYVEHQGKARFLAPPLTSGSGFVHVTDEGYYVLSELTQENTRHLSLATITCFMFNQETTKEEEVWAVSVGHAIANVEHEDNGTHNQGCGFGRATPQTNFMKFSDAYKSVLSRYGRNEYLIDTSVFKVTDRVWQQNRVKMGIPCVRDNPVVCRKNSKSLLGCKVFKTGIATGYREGIITDVNQGYKLNNMMCSGLFVVKSTTPGKVFADICDSGAAVILGTEVIGSVIGIRGEKIDGQWVENIVLCARLDRTLRYIHKEWKLKLGFQQNDATDSVDEPEEDILQLEKIKGTYRDMRAENKRLKESRPKLQRASDEKDRRIMMLHKKNSDLQRNVKTFRDHILGQIVYPPRLSDEQPMSPRSRQGTTQSIEEIDETEIVHQQVSAEDSSPQSRDTLREEDGDLQLDETTMKDEYLPTLKISEPVRVIVQGILPDKLHDSSDETVLVYPPSGGGIDRVEEPSARTEASDREPVAVVVKSILPEGRYDSSDETVLVNPPSGGGGIDPVEQPSVRTEASETSADSSPEHPEADRENPETQNSMEEEPLIFCHVAQDEEKELISCLNGSPQQSLRSVVQECVSRSTNQDSLAVYMTDEPINGYRLLNIVKLSSLRQKELFQILKQYELTKVTSIWRRGAIKEFLHGEHQKKGLDRFASIFHGVDMPSAQTILKCEFQDQQGRMFCQFLREIKDLSTLTKILQNFCLVYPDRVASVVL